MVALLVLTLLPVAFVVSLGWLAGKWSILDANQSGLLAAFVVQFTLPADLFLAAARAKPEQIENWRFVVGLTLGLVIVYILGLLLAITVFRHTVAEGALAAMNGSFPNMAAMGIPILGSLFGPSSLLSVLTGNLITNLIMMPVTLSLLEFGVGEERGRRTFWYCLISSLRQPLVWAPFAGILLALAGVSLPEGVNRSLKLIGDVTPAVSLFSLGLILSQQTIRLTVEVVGNVLMKAVIQPALMALLVFVLDITGEKGGEMIILGTLPTATIATMLALRYKTLTAESSTTVLLSTVLSVPALAGVIAFTT